MKAITIKIQSFVDVITNSSTTVYIMATKYTIDHLKMLVNAFLESIGSELTADEMFDFELEDEDLLVTPKDEKYTTVAKLLQNAVDFWDIDAETDY